MEAKESSILDAAETIFAQVGFDGAKVWRLRAASAAEGTVYLYYKNKQDLWPQSWVVSDSTDTGRRGSDRARCSYARAVGTTGSLPPQLILEQFEVVSLTYRARPQQQDLDQVREYVRVLDRIMQRGVDRSALPKGTPIGQLRDVFFGTLSFQPER